MLTAMLHTILGRESLGLEREICTPWEREDLELPLFLYSILFLLFYLNLHTQPFYLVEFSTKLRRKIFFFIVKKEIKYFLLLTNVVFLSFVNDRMSTFFFLIIKRKTLINVKWSVTYAYHYIMFTSTYCFFSSSTISHSNNFLKIIKIIIFN